MYGLATRELWDPREMPVRCMGSAHRARDRTCMVVHGGAHQTPGKLQTREMRVICKPVQLQAAVPNASAAEPSAGGWDAGVASQTAEVISAHVTIDKAASEAASSGASAQPLRVSKFDVATRRLPPPDIKVHR